MNAKFTVNTFIKSISKNIKTYEVSLYVLMGEKRCTMEEAIIILANNKYQLYKKLYA